MYFNTTGDGAPPGSPNGYDVITGFDGASGDRLVISGSLLTRLDDDSAATLSFFHVDQDTGFAENVTLDETCEVILFSQDSASIAEGDLLDTTIVANVLIDELVIDGPADGDDCLFIVESTTSGKYGLYYFSDTVNNTGTVDADELSVLAIITAEDFITATGDFSFG